MKAVVMIAVVADDGSELVGAHHEEVVVTTGDPEDTYLRAAKMLERTVPATHQHVRDQLTVVHEELKQEKAKEQAGRGGRRR